MKNIIIGLISAIIIFAGGLLIGKLYFSKTDIKVTERIVYKTQWKEKPAADLPFTQQNFNNLLFCAVSDINFKDRAESDYLFITAFDECKENTARYKIGTKGDWAVYLGVGVVAFAGGSYLAYKLLKR
jgi:hypothetical protein